MAYLWAGFVLTWGAIVGYAWRLERRAAATGRRLERLSPPSDGGRTDPAGPPDVPGTPGPAGPGRGGE